MEPMVVTHVRVELRGYELTVSCNRVPLRSRPEEVVAEFRIDPPCVVIQRMAKLADHLERVVTDVRKEPGQPLVVHTEKLTDLLSRLAAT